MTDNVLKKEDIFQNTKKEISNRCSRTLDVLNFYYDFETYPIIEPFVLPPNENENHEIQGQVLIHEDDEFISIGIEFHKKIWDSVKEKKLSLNSFSVISEETSHFKFILDTLERKEKTNILNLEILGEIDRFISFMHHDKIMGEKIYDIRNFHDICDIVFKNQNFKNLDNETYQKAENISFKHLKEAFSDKWDYTRIDFSQTEQSAKKYLTKLRKSLSF